MADSNRRDSTDVRSHRRRQLLAIGGVLIGLAAIFGWTSRSWWRPMSPEASHQRMIDRLSVYRTQSQQDNIYLGRAKLDQVSARLDGLEPTAPVSARWTLLYLKGKLQLYQGDEESAIATLHQAEKLLAEATESLPPEAVTQFRFDMGMAYLRLGETQNCCQRVTAESCIVPIQGAAIHRQREGSERAGDYFRQVLRTTPSDSTLHLSALWLLNIAHMTLGDYPQQVEPEYRIPESILSSEQEFPRFENVAKEHGVNTFSLAGGVIADDFNNDGTIDLVVSSWDPSESLRIFWNRDGKFVDGSERANLREICGGLNLIQADYNNDGFQDILVLRGGWLVQQGRVPSSLLRNNGDGTFVDVSYASGLAVVSHPTQTASWADYDLDGDLDLYVGHEWLPENPAPGSLFRNEGNEKFVDVAAQAGVMNGLMAKSVIWGDYDGDRWPDLYVSNFGGPNRLYHNQQDGTFEDVAPQMNVTEPVHSFPSWFWDYDNDGDLDLFVASYSGGIAELASQALHGTVPGKTVLPKLYRNDGAEGFRDVAEQVNLRKPHHPMGANFADLDNDGFLDFYLGTGWPEYHELMPNALYRNDGGRRFLDVTSAAGMGHLQKGHGIAMADFDADGDLDVFEQMGGFFRGDRFYDVLYANPGFGHHWIGVKLIGTTSNRAAIGARIRVELRDGTTSRSIYRWVNSGATFGANPLQPLIGIGAAEQVELVEVYWPKSDQTQRFENLPVDRWTVITEGSSQTTEIAQPAARGWLSPAFGRKAG